MAKKVQSVGKAVKAAIRQKNKENLKYAAKTQYSYAKRHPKQTRAELGKLGLNTLKQGLAAYKYGKLAHHHGKNLPNIARGAARTIKKVSKGGGVKGVAKKIGMVAAAPLLPLAYGVSHGVRKPAEAAKTIGLGAIKGGPAGAINATYNFHKKSISDDLDWLAKKGRKK